MSKFQFITLALFIIFIIGGVIAFATFKGGDSTEQLPPITVWGTFPADTFDEYVSSVNNTLPQPLQVTYVQKQASQFSTDFIAALARGTGPDAVLVPADVLYPHSDKITPIPYSALSQRDFRDLFVRQAEIYLVADGTLALPFTLDPLIMYWNRDMFDAAGLALYPRYWDEFNAIIPKLTVKDQNGNIRKSAIALGEFSNVTNAREILATFLFQLGNPITVRDEDGLITSAFNPNAAVSPEPALEFFTRFSNPTGSVYSWNRGMPTSKSAFLSGTLATYFGFASELFDLRAKNPNLNFDAALLPQLRQGGERAVYAKMYGLSIVRASANPNAVFQVISLLSAPQFLSDLSQKMYLPPVRRDLIAAGSEDPYISIFGQAALISRTWLDADPLVSFKIMSDMVGAITSGKKTISQAISDAGDQYDVALRQVVQ